MVFVIRLISLFFFLTYKNFLLNKFNNTITLTTNILREQFSWVGLDEIQSEGGGDIIKDLIDRHDGIANMQ